MTSQSVRAWQFRAPALHGVKKMYVTQYYPGSQAVASEEGRPADPLDKKRGDREWNKPVRSVGFTRDV